MDYKYESFALLNMEPDLVFLQEAQLSAVSFILKIKDKYDAKHIKEEGCNSKYNCLLYKLDKFKCVDIFPGYDYRKCIAKLQLKDVEGYLLPKYILAVSCHLPYHQLSDKQRLENAEQLFKELNQHQLYAKCPVLVGGDFNCDIMKLQKASSLKTNFEIPGYDVTEHRRRKAGIKKSNVCIDYFAYNNYDDNVTVKISDVRAHIINKTESRHDPLSAELTISQSHFNILSFNMNGRTSEMITQYINKLSPTPNICILHDIPQEFNTTFPAAGSPVVLHSKALTPLNTSKLSVERVCCESVGSAFKITLWEMLFKNYPGHHPVIIVSCHKAQVTINNITESDVESLFETLNKKYSGKHSVLIAGDFNIYKIIKDNPNFVDNMYKQFTIPTYKPTIHRAVYGGMDDACTDFFAYRTNTTNSVVFQQVSVNPEMICPCPNDLVTYTKHGQCYVDTKHSILTDIHYASPHDPLRGELFIEIKLSSFKLLCINARDTTEQNIHTYCCSKISPKPDVCIFQNLSQELGRQIHRGNSATSHFIGTKDDLRFICGKDSGFLKCIKYEPRFRKNDHKIIIKLADFKYNFDCITNSPLPPIITFALICEESSFEQCLKYLSQIQKWSMVVVGTFDVNEFDQKGFTVLKCYSKEAHTCVGFFAYKNCNKSGAAIELSDLGAEATTEPSEAPEEQHYALRATMHVKVRPPL